MGPHGGVVLSLKSMAWSYAECPGSSNDPSVVIMAMISKYSVGTQSIPACSSSFMVAAAI